VASVEIDEALDGRTAEQPRAIQQMLAPLTR